MKPDILINLMIPMTNPIKLTIKERIQETPDTITLRFEETFDELPYKSGQFLTVLVSINQEEYRREYAHLESVNVWILIYSFYVVADIIGG